MISEKRELKECLIEVVKAHPCLWDKQCSDFKDHSIKNNAWKEILDNLRSLTEDRNLLHPTSVSWELAKVLEENLRQLHQGEKNCERKVRLGVLMRFSQTGPTTTQCCSWTKPTSTEEGHQEHRVSSTASKMRMKMTLRMTEVSMTMVRRSRGTTIIRRRQAWVILMV